MRRMIVIADDITGAAEIAGIAKRHGIPTSLVIFDSGVQEFKEFRSSDNSLHSSKNNVCTPVFLYVVATDTRSMDAMCAATETRGVVRWVKQFLLDERRKMLDEALWFKKTDSALRGHVMEELEAMMAETGHRKALYLPANPSRGRTVKDGIYYVQGIPIDQTDFSFDPDFPATTSSIEKRFPGIQNEECRMKNEESIVNCQLKTSIFNIHPSISYANAETIEDVRKAVQLTDDDTLLAGAADLFEAFINEECRMKNEESDGANGSQSDNSSSLIPHPLSLVVCGSTQSRPNALGVPVLQIPREVYDGEWDVNEWIDGFLATHPRPRPLALSFGNNTHRTGKEAALYLRNVMAEAAARVINAYHPVQLFIEGGATAFRLLQRLGWHSFTVCQELTPGVVRMQAEHGVFVILKPGSYDWGISK